MKSQSLTSAAVPLWQGLISDFNANYTTWVSDTADADQAYSDELADNAVAWVQDFNAAVETCSNDFVSHWVTYTESTTALHVAQISTISSALNGWATAVAAQLNVGSGTPTFAAAANAGSSGYALGGGTLFPPTVMPNLPEGCSLDPRTGFVYQGATLFGIIDQNGNVVWPTAWPPGGPTATVTSLGPDVVAGFFQSVLFPGPANLRGKLQSRYGKGTVTPIKMLPGASVDKEMTRTTNIPEGFIVGCGGAEP